MHASKRNAVSNLFLLSTLAMAAASVNAANQSVNVDPVTGLATAVVVENKAIAHTTQLLPVDAEGAINGDTLVEQLRQVVANVNTALTEVGSDLSQLVRLNIYVTSDALVGETQALLKTVLGPNSHPVTTSVVTPLPAPNALVALDAIATVTDDQAPAQVRRHTSDALPSHNGAAHVVVLPKGRTLYISGMAESVQDLAEATTGTMKQLHTVLALNGIGTAEVVHVKAYMKPMDQINVAAKAMAAFYPENAAPAMTFLEWRNGLPIEIELIAHLPTPTDSTDPVELRWQPEEKRSPVYCRFAVVNSPTRIYTSGFMATDDVDAKKQIHSIYSQLEAAVTPLGSDFRHLVKATYLHSADDTSVALNEIRPEYYDPKRPPAASKALIAGTGDKKRSMTVDMIAVPRELNWSAPQTPDRAK